MAAALSAVGLSSARTVDAMLRKYDASIDGPFDAAEAKRYRIVNGERVCGWSCDPHGPYYEQDKHLCPPECKPGYVPPPGKPRPERIDDVCRDAPPPPQPAAVGRGSCADGAEALAAAGVWMLIGVQTGPFNGARRDGIRASWKRWEQDTAGVLVCFLLGRVGLPSADLAALDAEEQRHRDILWLENATDAGVDDDSFLHLGNLAGDMRRLHCVTHLHYGSMAFTGYDPSVWQMCGWSWQPYGGNFRKERCARRGAYAPFPFMNGVLELLSAPLVRHVATSPAVRAFVQRAEAAIAARLAAGWSMSLKKGQRGPRVWRQNEDVALGFWISRAERHGLFNVTWVRINDRAMNMACISTKGMYQRPRNDTISIHFLKRAGGSEYLWGHLHDGVPHSAQNCSRWVWHDACRNPKDAETPWCRQHANDAIDPHFDDRPLRAEDKKALRRRRLP